MPREPKREVCYQIYGDNWHSIDKNPRKSLAKNFLNAAEWNVDRAVEMYREYLERNSLTTEPIQSVVIRSPVTESPISQIRTHVSSGRMAPPSNSRITPKSKHERNCVGFGIKPITGVPDDQKLKISITRFMQQFNIKNKGDLNVWCGVSRNSRRNTKAYKWQKYLSENYPDAWYSYKNEENAIRVSNYKFNEEFES